MLLSSFFTVMLLLLDGRLSESQNNDPKLQTVKIQGTAKFKPGGSAMVLSLLVKGEPGLMPSGNQGATPTSSSGSSGSSGTSAPGQSTSSPSGSSGSGQSTSGPTPSGSSGSGQSTTAQSTTAGSSGSGQSATAGSSGGFKDYEQEGLKLHNKFRKVHSAKPMKLNKKMCEEAQAYAEKIAARGGLQHSQRSEREGQGENLSMGCSSSKGGQTVTEGVTNWYNEVCSPGYTFGQGGGAGGAGHFTQVVWNDSVELGIGKAEGNKGRMKCAYIVGRYKPLGNFDTGNDDYTKNVLKGSFDRSSYCANVKPSGFKDAISKKL